MFVNDAKPEAGALESGLTVDRAGQSEEITMTTMAPTDPPLRRLFSRLDLGSRPQQEGLADLLARWEELRGASIAPREPLARSTLPSDAFLFKRMSSGRDYVLECRGSKLEDLLGSAQIGDRLSAAPKARQAVRLRRLFDAVLQAVTPILAEFSIKGHGEQASVVDLLVAPICDAEGRMTGILGRCELRPAPAGGARQPSRWASPDGPVLFALANSRALANGVAERLGTTIEAHEERDFEDGEHKIRPLVSVRNRSVYVFADLVTSPGQSVNDKLCKLLFFVGALKQSAARSVTVVAPYLCYARKERQTKPRDPVATRYLAQMFEAVGVDCVIALTAHNVAAFQNAFRCRTEHLDTDALFAKVFATRLTDRQIAVVSPDIGGEKRAELFREKLERVLDRPVAKAFLDKTRSMGKVTGDIFAGDVAERVAIILDDMISTGGTMVRAAQACRRHGAGEVLVAATHGLFTGGAEALLAEPSIDEIWISDSVALSPVVQTHVARGRVHLLPLGDLLAGAIQRCHSGGSINELLEREQRPQP
jgi:ribose-phosphate pyrophosphokinase